MFLLQPPHICSEPPDIIPSPQLLQFRLRGEQECQQSGIQKGIQAWFNIERRRALKDYAHFPVLSFAKKTGGMEEGVKGWGEERKKCLGWALCAFYLVGSLPRRGLPPAEPAGRSNERREELLPPPRHCRSPLPTRKRKGGKSKRPHDANSSHCSWGAPSQPAAPMEGQEISPLTGKWDPREIQMWSAGWPVSPWRGQHCPTALNQQGRSPVAPTSISPGSRHARSSTVPDLSEPDSSKQLN